MITEANQVGPPKALSGKGDTAVCKEVKPQIRREELCWLTKSPLIGHERRITGGSCYGEPPS